MVGEGLLESGDAVTPRVVGLFEDDVPDEENLEQSNPPVRSNIRNNIASATLSDFNIQHSFVTVLKTVYISSP